jgi:hypothetical protein
MNQVVERDLERALRALEYGKAYAKPEYGTARLVAPAPSGYLLLAAEVDAQPFFLWTSRTKRHLIEDASAWCARIAQEAGVLEAVTFKAVLIPPLGEAAFLRRRPNEFHRARFDLAILVETDSVERAEALRRHALFRGFEDRVREEAGHVYVVAASNAKRLGAVDHARDGVFLFNYFFADSPAQNLAAWERTAGWFQQKTGLDNSTVLMPMHADLSQYTLIDHARWDRLSDILPSLLLERSFRDFVLAQFDASDAAPMPIFYRLAR